MTGIQASARVRWLVAYVLLGSVFTILHAHAQGAVTQSDASAGVIRFDLPAQPLATALLVFGSAAGMLVGVKSSLLDGRTSAPVHGNYSPREALQCLLAGTGLEANFPSEDEAIIVPASLTQQPAPPPPPEATDDSSIDGVEAGSDFRSYASMVQFRLTEALCRSPLTRPGSYRLVAQLRIDDAGSVVASKLVDSTGSPARDAAVEQALGSLALDSAPPVGLPQPITILVRQQSGRVGIDCAQYVQAGQRP